MGDLLPSSSTLSFGPLLILNQVDVRLQWRLFVFQMFRDQGQLLKSLQDTVLQYLKWPTALEVAIHPIGLDEAIQHFEDFMAREQQNENEKVKVVGIVGLGGSGKTTLAKEFYNRKSKRYSFNGSSFLFDVRDASTKNELPRLESKLLGDLSLLKGCRIDNISEGKGIIRARLQSSTPNVLIILGDIDPEDQTEDLVVRDVLRSGSSIIVTSREESTLKHSGASLIYKIKGLNPEQSQELFCMYAFQQPTPIIGFEESVKKFCKMCGGLPLFLKVMGAHLRFEANNRDDWEDELEHIPEDIRSILNISYDTLHKEEMQIFLDIACFFLGEDKNLAIRVWDTSEGRGSCRRLTNLENKCLVEFDDKNRFKMHDRVRDFGRRIAQDESPCRLWYDDQAASRPKQHKGTMEARGIVAATSYWSLSFERKIGSSYCRSFYQPPLNEIEMSKLKLLVVKGDCFDEQFHKRSENLLWLRWFDCQHANISPWLMSMRNLTVLELVGANLKEWQLFGEQVHLRGLRI